MQEESTDPEPAAKRPARWRRAVTTVAAVLMFWSAAGAGAAEAYIESVPVPGAAPQPQASVLYYRDGKTILARVGATDHNDVPLSAISPALRQAVLLAEDRDFYDHAGVSLRGVARAMVADVSGKRQGASTITQQYARNAFLSQRVTVDRKMQELALAVNLERQYGKDEILARYLNTIYYGRGAYGIAAAANAYFGVTPDRLDFAQSAVLAAVIKDPWTYDPDHDATAARRRWNWIFATARDAGLIDPATVTYPDIRPAGSAIGGPLGLVVDQVERELAGHGISSRQLHTQGLRVVTTLEQAAERAAVDSVRAHLHGQPAGLRAALVALDPATGGVRAYYGGEHGSGYFDNASAPHPAASTFKAIVLAAALGRGIAYQSRWDGSSPRLFPDRGVPLRNHDNLQCAECTLQHAMVDSLNTPFYAVTAQIGPNRVRDMAVRLGIPEKYDGRKSMVDVKGDPAPGKTRGDIALGRYPVVPGDLATVYATLAGNGVRHQRHFVESVTGADGSGYTTPDTPATVLDPKIAADVTTVLTSVVKEHGITPGRPAAGKTGTQQYRDTLDNQDAWMAGYTPELASVVWIGKAKPGPLRDARNKRIEGDTMPSYLWRDFTRSALRGTPVSALPRPAHVGRTDAGDFGKTGHDEKNPDSVTTLHAAAAGYQPVVRTEHAGKRLALTFDDGPAEDTPAVLDLLAQYHVKATFCVVGENATWYPQLVRRIVADGHRLCNHSMHHDDLGILSEAKSRADIAEADAAIAEAVPGATVTYYRAPYGDFGPSAKAGGKAGHTPLGWVVDPDDWLLPGADVIAARIKQQLTPRAVVLVHDGGGDRKQTVAALRKLIPQLLADGWTFDQPETTVVSKPLPGPRASASSPAPSVSPSVSSSPSLSPSVSDSASPSVSPSSSPSDPVSSGPAPSVSVPTPSDSASRGRPSRNR
ncbi:transglycosylase domain-containing protein [Actinoplanes oblitus]|uniref:Transglycosylase domain-containing protein n=1 Tax=Actinoplanes oblitus TaxID=3040509 RepID=A0ABY8WNY4_9ACTN|nr:transglycosylase domain-containing protein [Actinoplanes oblitus]WIM98731.1 transglycosylase domain-containing protein [Actinoplanes oblitus]